MSNNREMIKGIFKALIPQNQLSSVRIIYRIVMETIYGIKRTGIMNIAIIAALAAILTIFGALFRTSYSLSAFVDKLGNAFEISVYLNSNTDVSYMSSVLNEIEHVKKTKIIPKEQAWEEMSGELDVKGLENPLPDTIRLTIDDPKNISEVCTKIKKISGIEDLSYAQAFAEKLQTLTNVFNTVTLIVLIIVAILTIIIINSTIQLVIQSRKEEIEIMRLMGVSNWYIKIPLILQGSTYGFLGAIISLLPLNTVHNGLIKIHDTFMLTQTSDLAMNTVVFCLFIMSILFSAGGSVISIKKHLQV